MDGDEVRSELENADKDQREALECPTKAQTLWETRRREKRFQNNYTGGHPGKTKQLLGSEEVRKAEEWKRINSTASS